MEKNTQQTDIITDNFVSDIRTIIEQGRKQAYAATGQIAIMTYWNIGRRIVEEEQQGASRAAYGQKLIPALAVRLAAEYGTGYGKRNLAYGRRLDRFRTWRRRSEAALNVQSHRRSGHGI